MEILNYDCEKRCIKKSTKKNLGDLITKIRELNWDYSDKDYQFSVRSMKVLEEKIKNQTKKNSKNEKAEIIKILYSQIPKPWENQFKCNIIFNEKEPKTIKIDYFCLISIVNIIAYILKDIISQNNFPQLLNELIVNENFSQIVDKEIWGMSLMKYKSIFNEIETISFNLSGAHDKNIDINYTILFYIFFNLFFKNAKNFIINLNASRINNIYNVDKNPYKIKEKDVVVFASNFGNLFLSNFVLISLISNLENLTSLRLIMVESFINELNSLFEKEFENSQFNEMIQKKNSLIYFRKLMMIKKISKLSISINALDIFLFREIINLIAINRDAEQLELELFSDPKFFNLRKLCLNYLTGQEFHEIDPNIIDRYQIIMYPYIDSLEDKNLTLIEEEKIPDLLYPNFQKNLSNLKLILDDYIPNFKNFYLDISPYMDLTKYDNYNIEILIFIFVVLSAFEKSQKIETLHLKCLNIKYSSVYEVKKRIIKLTDGKLIDLTKCGELKNLSLNMEGISLYLDFNKLPYTNLKQLKMTISNLKDIQALNEVLSTKKEEVKLKDINLKINLMNSEQILKELFKIYENIPDSLESLKITIDNNLSKLEILQIIKIAYKKIKNKKIIYNLNCNSKEFEEFLSDTKIYQLNEFFVNNNVNFITKCKKQENSRIFNINMAKWPEKDILESVINVFNKKININDPNEKKNENKKMLSKIFNFMGKDQDFTIILK